MRSLNDKINGWLTSKLIAAPGGSFKTEQPDGGDDRIVEWNEGLLGPQPSVEDIDAAPPVPSPFPDAISDRQFAQALAIGGMISQTEALSWVKVGTVPARIQAVVDGISDQAAKFSANMLLAGATTFLRSHPMVAQLGAGLQMTSAQIDDIWRVGATL